MEVVGIGADLAPGTLVAGYRAGIFGMHDGGTAQDGDLLWWSPDPRGVLNPDRVHVARSMHRTRNRLQVSLDVDFAAVVAGCADPRRHGAWITRDYQKSYQELHRLGWAHSIEVWDAEELVAGLFGVEVGALFAAESMFHRPDWGASASRLAVIALCELLCGSDRLIDVQWRTDHLALLGVQELSRPEYLARLAELVTREPVLGQRARELPGPGSGRYRIRWRG